MRSKICHKLWTKRHYRGLCLHFWLSLCSLSFPCVRTFTDVYFSYCRRFSSAVQEHLSRGEGDIADLISLNNQRGREHGVPGYTVYRNLPLCNIVPKVNSFDDLKKAGFDPKDIKNLKKVYTHVEDIDLFTGGKFVTKKRALFERLRES